MQASSVPSAFRRLPPVLVDAVAAAVLLGIDVAAWLTTPQPAGGIRDSRTIALVVLVLASAPLAWRRRWPLTVLALTFVALTAHEALGFPHAPMLGPYLALYSAGAHREPRPSAIAAAVAIAVYCAAFVSGVMRGEIAPVALVHNFALVVVLWGFGASVRRTRSYAAELEDRAARLEREREEKARRAVADERARIARELHDVVAHNVSVMVVQAGGARRVLEARPNQARTALESIETTGRQALAEMRRLLGILRANGDAVRPLEPQPGVDQLGSLVTQLEDAG
ncbi:MAG: histidine kinase dimerization/phosphoacceptor domain-containing protein, partial [Actinomycetota bacterium]|nr:histidine kinase dimerization/phosphoacceptor domain-containing protein [Actinomycetota bacterium]